MTGLCSNCEVAPASVICLNCCSNCGDVEGRFCAECASMHLRIKQFKSHSVVSLSSSTLKMSAGQIRTVDNITKKPQVSHNMEMTVDETAASRNRSLDQPISFAINPRTFYRRYVSNTMLDRGINSAIDALDAFVDIISAAFEDRAVVEVVDSRGGVVSGGTGPGTIFMCLIIALGIHLLTKYVFRRKAVFALIGAGLFAFKSFKNKREELSKELDSIQKTSSEVRGSLRRFESSSLAVKSVPRQAAAGICNSKRRGKLGGPRDCKIGLDESEGIDADVDYDDDDFRFWYERDESCGRQATLRPRGARKYQSRTAQLRSDSPGKRNKMEKHETSDTKYHEKVN